MSGWRKESGATRRRKSSMKMAWVRNNCLILDKKWGKINFVGEVQVSGNKKYKWEMIKLEYIFMLK